MIPDVAPQESEGSDRTGGGPADLVKRVPDCSLRHDQTRAQLAIIYWRFRVLLYPIAAIASAIAGVLNDWPRGPWMMLLLIAMSTHALLIWRSDILLRTTATLLIDSVTLAIVSFYASDTAVVLLATTLAAVLSAALTRGVTVTRLWLFQAILIPGAFGLAQLIPLPDQPSSTRAVTIATTAALLGLALVLIPAVLVRSLDGANSAHLEALEEIASRERRFAGMLEHAYDGVLLTDADGVLLYVGQHNRHTTGYESHERLGGLVTDLIVEDDLPVMNRAWTELLDKPGGTVRMRLRSRHRDGSTRVIDLTATNRLDDPDLRGIVTNYRDVTGEAKAEEALRHSNEQLETLVKSKDEFIASVSHELRTPLTAVVALALEMRDNRDDFCHDELTEFHATLAEQASDVASIVEDLLVAARADIGGVTILRSTCDLVSLVRGVVTDLVGVSPVEFSAPDRLDMELDPLRVKQIIRNLVANADRYGGDRIRVSIGQERDRVVVCVQDDGSPVPESERERIFAPFERARLSRTQPASIGLGLTVSRTLAQLMGGNVRYDHRDGWSTFDLILPLTVPVSA